MDELVNPKYGINMSVKSAAREVSSQNGAVDSLFTISESSC